MKKPLILTVVSLVLTLASCGGQPSSSSSAPASKTYFSLWNECSSLTALKNYVEDVTNKDSKNYIPVEDRIATFDMDGT
ncbi:MAG: haloacid dehalogenase-like hydrolase, partial [Bacilli bacterium]|nr:haloacid dehalogenase-like hydrolase [Bacilli bacterium]